ncbi:MAG: hypothetical protein LBD61_01020, partial [Endomicrobium sp.]|nr:hypothetical protein [Endomicrobium sp.]
NGKVEGIIGLAIDITDRKKKEELKSELKRREELYTIAKEVAHDICSPLSALEVVKYMLVDKVSEKERKMLELSTRRLKEIMDKLIVQYRNSQKKGKLVEKKEPDDIMVNRITELISSISYSSIFIR